MKMLGLIIIVALDLTLAACGGRLFPKCDDPTHPCPDVEPDYPPPAPFAAPKDAGRG